MANIYTSQDQAGITGVQDAQRFADATNATLVGFLKVMWPFIAIIILGSIATSLVVAKKEKGGGGKGNKAGGGKH